MAVTCKYTGEDGRHYPYLPLADGSVGWVAEHDATVEITAADAVPDDGRFEPAARGKKTAMPAASTADQGEQS